MEKRFYLGLGILLVFLFLGIFTAVAMDRAMEPIQTYLQQAAQDALGSDPATGIHLAQQAKDAWFSLRSKIAAVADHTPMEEVDGLFAELEVYAQSGDMAHFSACCTRIAILSSALAEAHAFSLQTLL